MLAALLVSLVVVSAGFAGGRKCSNSPKECEREIRAMLTGKPVPLGFIVQPGADGVGIVVKTVTPESPAEKAGLKAGDRLLALDRYDVSKASLAELRRVRERLMEQKEKEPGSGKIVLTINRVGAFKRLSLRIERMSKAQIDKIVAAHLREAHGSDEGSDQADRRDR